MVRISKWFVHVWYKVLSIFLEPTVKIEVQGLNITIFFSVWLLASEREGLEVPALLPFFQICRFVVELLLFGISKPAWNVWETEVVFLQGRLPGS